MAVYSNQSMQVAVIAAINAQPALQHIIVARNREAEAFFGNSFNLYEQGCFKVVLDRAQAAPPGVPATSTKIQGQRKKQCSICNAPVNDFNRHNRMHHIRDPGHAFFCPKDDCTFVTFYEGENLRDTHLARHNCFPNLDGLGGEFLYRSTSDAVLKRLNKTTMRFIADAEQTRLASVENRRNFYVNNYGGYYPKLLEHQMFLPDYLRPAQNTPPAAMSCPDARRYVIALRRVFDVWETHILVAQHEFSAPLFDGY